MKRTVLALAVATLACSPSAKTKTAAQTRSVDEATPRHIMIDSRRPGPTVLIVAGMHGNEYAGFRAAMQISSWQVQRGRLVVVPRANVAGIQRNKREVPGLGDLNRQFEHGPTAHALPRGLWDLVKTTDPDWVVDLHEAWVRAPGDGKSGTCDNAAIAEAVLWANAGPEPNRVHAAAEKMAEAAGGFETIEMAIPSMLTLASSRLLGTRALLVETWWGHHTLPARIAQHTRAVHALLDELEMGVAVPAAAGKHHEGRLLRASPAHSRLALEPIVRIAHANRQWATAEMTAFLVETSHWVRHRWSDGERLQIADISATGGGPLTPHESHQIGLDVDVQYLRKNHAEEKHGSRWFTESFVRAGAPTSNFDADRNYELLRHIVEEYDIAAIYIDKVLIEAMRGCAAATKDAREAKWMGTLHHYPHHADHFHVRLACPPGHAACKDSPGQGCVSCTTTCKH